MWSESLIFQELHFANCKNDANSREQKFNNNNLKILNISQKWKKFGKSQNLILAKMYSLKVKEYLMKAVKVDGFSSSI